MAVRIENRQKKVKIDIRRLRPVLHNLMNILSCGDKELSLVLTDDEGIRIINRDYRNRNYPTNVISFSLSEGDFGHINPGILGDVIVSTEKTQSDAQENGVPFEDLLDFYIIHGLLHLLGYDHEHSGRQEAMRMKKKEEELFLVLKGYRI